MESHVPRWLKVGTTVGVLVIALAVAFLPIRDGCWHLRETFSWDGVWWSGGTVMGTGGDFDGDGVEEVILVSYRGTRRRGNCGKTQEILVLSGADFTELHRHALNELPRRAHVGTFTTWMLGPGGVEATDDRDGDSVPEIVVGCLVGMGPSQHHCWQTALIVSGSTGDVLYFLEPVRGFSEPAPARHVFEIPDLTGDGVRDFVLSNAESHLCSGATGEVVKRPLPGFGAVPYFDCVLPTSDDAPEAGSLASYPPRIIRCEAPHRYPSAWYPDTDGDGQAELVVSKAGDTIGLVRSASGEFVPLFQAESGQQFGGATCLGDLDGDQVDDILVRSCGRGSVLTAVSGADGRFLYELTYSRDGLTRGQILPVEDWDGDGVRDFIFGGNRAFSVRSGANGRELQRVELQPR